MYTVQCKICEKYYESKRNVPGICSDCKTSARSKNNTRYRDRNYDQVLFYVPKGKRDDLKQYAKDNAMSMNEFINNAIELYMQTLEQEKAKSALGAIPVKVLPDDFDPPF